MSHFYGRVSTTDRRDTAAGLQVLDKLKRDLESRLSCAFRLGGGFLETAPLKVNDGNGDDYLVCVVRAQISARRLKKQRPATARRLQLDVRLARGALA